MVNQIQFKFLVLLFKQKSKCTFYWYMFFVLVLFNASKPICPNTLNMEKKLGMVYYFGKTNQDDNQFDGTNYAIIVNKMFRHYFFSQHHKLLIINDLVLRRRIQC